MTQHDHPEYIEGCFRCDLGREEVEVVKMVNVPENDLDW